MARRSNRDYRAEYAARNARAQALGFESYSQLRRAQERQEFSRRIGPAFPSYAKAGFRTQEDYQQSRKEAQQWSKRHSQKESSAYVKGMNAEQLAAYNQAFINTRFTSHAQRIEELRYYLVDVMEYMTDEEFEHDSNYN